MMHELETQRRQADAHMHMHATMMREFCDVLKQSGLPPMVVMRFAALSLGAIYREVADAHMGPDACPCGWQPQEKSDLEVLLAALATAARRNPVQSLATMGVAGSA